MNVDIRDPDTFALQLLLGWFFGSTEPRETPIPIHVGSHIGHYYNTRDATRAAMHNVINVLTFTLDPQDVRHDPTMPRFGYAKCETGDTAGRWINMDNDKCASPLCTGDRVKTVNGIDVRTL